MNTMRCVDAAPDSCDRVDMAWTTAAGCVFGPAAAYGVVLRDEWPLARYGVGASEYLRAKCASYTAVAVVPQAPDEALPLPRRGQPGCARLGGVAQSTIHRALGPERAAELWR